MNYFFKCGLLFTLVVVGRYMQLVAPAAASIQHQAEMVLLPPTDPTLTQYVNYIGFPETPVGPASQRKRPSSSWY